jgi:hypothetical protein
MFCANCGTPVEEGAAFCTNCGTPVKTGAAANRQPQQCAYTPPGKKVSRFKIFLIVIPFLYICCFVLGSSDFVYYGLLHWDSPPPFLITLLEVTLFLVIYGPSTVLLFFILKHCFKRQKITALVFSIPLALWFIVLLFLAFVSGLSYFLHHLMIMITEHQIISFEYIYSLEFFLYYSSIFAIIAIAYPFIPPLLTLIRFEGSRPQSTAVKNSSAIPGIRGSVTAAGNGPKVEKARL